MTRREDRTAREAMGTASEHYVANRAKAIFLLDRMLKHLQGDRQSRDDSKVNWGDSGTMASQVSVLQNVHDAMFREGEYAK